MTAPAASPSRQRFALIDISRGFFILFMMVGHTITFAYQGLNPIPWAISGLADVVCFSALLLLSGMAGYISYIHEQHTTLSVVNRILKRLNMYVLGYWLVALLGYLRSSPLGLEAIWKIISFQILIPYTEFIPAFILFALLKLCSRSLIRKITHQLGFFFVTSLGIYLIGLLLHNAPLGFPTAWQTLFVGSPGAYGFPVFYYAPIFFLGLYLGYKLYSHGNFHLVKPLTVIFSACLMLIGGGLLINVLFPEYGAILNRWPPSISFISLSLLAILTVLLFSIKTKVLHHFPGIKALLILCGQNAFALFFTHTSIMFVYDLLKFPLVSNSFSLLVLIIASVSLAIYLAKIAPFNYSFGFTVYAVFEDGRLTTIEEHRLSRALRLLFRQISALGSLLSVTVRGRKLSVFNIKSVSLASIILVLANTPIGIAEESLLLANIIEANPPTLKQNWFLTTNPQTSLLLELPAEISSLNVAVHAVIDKKARFEFSSSGTSLEALVPMAGLSPGAHSLEYEYAVNKVVYTTPPQQFFVSHPLYISWTIDWEGYSTPNAYLAALEQFSTDYSMPMTHLFNPRIYYTTEVSPERAEYESQWVKNRLQKGDDFGLHLHMHPDFIASASVVPKLQPVWGGGFSPGYDVPTTAYSYEEMVQILEYAKSVLVNHGFPQPRFYRAGAWFADSDTLNALQDTGFLADTSGRTSYQFGTNKITGPWSLSSTTQPYYPSTSNQNSPFPLPRLSILEIPNNGADSYWFSDVDLIRRSKDNFAGEPLQGPLQLTFLTHPHWFDPQEQKRIEILFNYLKSIHHQHGQGPAIFVGLSQIYEAFK